MDNNNLNNQQINQTVNNQQSTVNKTPVNTQQPVNLPPVSNKPIIDKKIINKYILIVTNLWMKLNPAIRKVIMITGFIFGLFMLIAIIFSVSTKIGGKVKSIPKPTMGIEQSPLPEIIINPSRYATDSAILAVEENLKIIEKEIGITVINDLKLSPPNLLWDINFEE
jgi:hypothetical protein